MQNVAYEAFFRSEHPRLLKQWLETRLNTQLELLFPLFDEEFLNAYRDCEERVSRAYDEGHRRGPDHAVPPTFSAAEGEMSLYAHAPESAECADRFSERATFEASYFDGFSEQGNLMMYPGFEAYEPSFDLAPQFAISEPVPHAESIATIRLSV